MPETDGQLYGYLYCVPPADIFDPRYAGVISLLRDGAFPLMSYEDVLMSYYSRYPQYMQQSDLRDSERLVFSEPGDASADVSAPKPAAEPERPAPEPVQTAQPVPQKDEKPLPEDETGRAIVQYLRECGDTYADDIAAALDMDLSTLLSELTLLELDGFVETLFGKHYRAC